MLTEAVLKDILAQNFTDKEKALCCLALESVRARKIGDILEAAFSLGWRQVKNKNLSGIYSRSHGLACRLAGGWELSSEGVKFVETLTLPFVCSSTLMVSSKFKESLEQVADVDTRSFVMEAVVCFETNQHRAAVILAWVGAISVLQNYVVSCKLDEFNAEAKKINSNWKLAKTTDDLGLMKEDKFLDVLQSISVLGKNVKQELKKALTLRNGCGHPSSLKLAEHKVAAHIEDLILNVFAVKWYGGGT